MRKKISVYIAAAMFLALLAGCQRSTYPTGRVSEPKGEGVPSYQAQPNLSPAVKTR